MVVETKYGMTICEYTMADYFEGLVGKIYKLLPMYESKSDTLEKYLNSLLLELAGGKRVFVESKEFLELIMNLEGLLLIDNHAEFKSHIFKCTNMCTKFANSLKERG